MVVFKHGFTRGPRWARRIKSVFGSTTFKPPVRGYGASDFLGCGGIIADGYTQLRTLMEERCLKPAIAYEVKGRLPK